LTKFSDFCTISTESNERIERIKSAERIKISRIQGIIIMDIGLTKFSVSDLYSISTESSEKRNALASIERIKRAEQINIDRVNGITNYLTSSIIIKI
jgi:hypothetical protein